MSREHSIPTPSSRAFRSGRGDGRPHTARAVTLDPLLIHACASLALATTRYWWGVAPIVRRQMRRWRAQASEIADPRLRTLAVAKLEAEGFNAEAAGMLATLAPCSHRAHAVEAMVAIEILYDYLDGLTEQASGVAADTGERLFAALLDAVAPHRPAQGDYYRHHPSSEECYLPELVRAARGALASLPALAAVSDPMLAGALRGSRAQLRLHRMDSTDRGELERWARASATGSGMGWREHLAASACSVLAVHALIAAAADDGTTPMQATELDRAYVSMSVLPTILDGLVDSELDASSRGPGVLDLYPDMDAVRDGLERSVDELLARAARLPHGPHHVTMLAGVLAYYASSPGARREPVDGILDPLVRRLEPVAGLAMGVMRAWRAGRGLVGTASDSTQPTP